MTNIPGNNPYANIPNAIAFMEHQEEKHEDFYQMMSQPDALQKAIIMSVRDLKEIEAAKPGFFPAKLVKLALAAEPELGHPELLKYLIAKTGGM